MIPLKNFVTDAKNFFEVVREYEGSYSYEQKQGAKDELAPPLINKGQGNVKVRITFEGSQWAAAQAKETETLLASAKEVGASLELKKIRDAAETYMKNADAKSGYKITSKAALQNFLDGAGLLQTVLDLDAFSMKNLMVYSPEKSTLASYEKSRLAGTSEWRNQQLDLLWAMCDLDGDGSVTFQELLMVLAMKSNSNPVERGEFAFQLLDKDKSGNLSISELLTMQQIYYKSFKILFLKEFLSKVSEETIKKGVFLRHEVTEEITKKVQSTLDGAGIPERLANKILALADKDSSGDVSKEEYINFLKDPENEKSMTDLLATLLATVGLQAGMESAQVILRKNTKAFY